MTYRKIITKEAKIDTGLAVMLKVYLPDGTPMGTGYVVYYKGSDNGHPILSNFEGKMLQNDAWYTLFAHEHNLVIVPRNVQ